MVKRASLVVQIMVKPGNSSMMAASGGFRVVVDPVTGDWYGFDIDGSSDSATFNMSRSSDEGHTWQFVPGVNFPFLHSEDYLRSQFDFVKVYNGNFIVKDDTELMVSTDGAASFQAVPNLPFELANSKVFVLDGYLGIISGAEQYYRANLLDWFGTMEAPQLPGATIDLSLAITMNPPNPAPWQNFEVTYTITNSGTIPATEIRLSNFIASNSNAVPQGGTSPLYDNLSGTTSFTLPAGESGSVTYFYFRLDGAPIQPWGQITGHLEPDVDSYPSNSSYPFVNEDDEALYNPDPACLDDLTPPTLTPCPMDINVSIVGVDTFLQWELPTFSDNCPSFVNIITSPAENPYYFGQGSFPVGTNVLVSYTATDASNNTSVCSFTITVNESSADTCATDNTPPILLNCPSNQSVSTTGSTAVVNWTAPTATDDCTAIVTIINDAPPGNSFNLGTTTVTYTATDDAGNTATCSFDVTVMQESIDPCETDNTPPTLLNCPSNQSTITAESSAVVNWTAPTATDNCTATVTIINDAPAGNSFNLGTTTVTYTATDDTGNTATCSFDVTVTQESNPGDGVDLNLSIAQANSSPSQWSSYSVELTLLNEGSAPASGIIVQVPKPDGVVYSGGNEYTTSQGTFDVFGGSNDWNVGSLNAGAQATLTINYFLLVPDAPVSYAQVIALNEADVDSSPNNGTCCVANEDDEASTDDSSPSPCDNDQIAPAITCPADIILDISGTSTPVNWSLPSTSDNCPGTVALSGSANPGDPFGLGTTSVTYDATDASGNSASCSFSVTVNQVIANEQPDLVLNNLAITNGPVAPGALLEFTFDLSNIGTADVPGTFSVKAYISTDNVLSADDIQDGIIPTGNFDAGITVANIGGASTIPADLSDGSYYLILVADADNEVAESDEMNNQEVASFEVQTNTNPGDPCGNVQILTAPGSISISNISLPHRIIKVFNPSWTTAVDCLDGACTDPLELTGLAAGTYFISVKLYDASWQFICEIEDFYMVPAALNIANSSDGLAQEENFSIQALAPNPVYQGETQLTIASSKDSFTTLFIYDNFGKLAQRLPVQLFAGRNQIMINTAELMDGVYHIYIPDQESRYHTVRFVVIKY